MSQPLDFQSIIMKLQQFWSEKGCIIWQPYYSQVGAGTMNPATYLRVLGPEPWNVAYVEPSIRPDDGRYGENPNRFQQHYQFQVIIKPDPGNPQELYLQSLQAIGIDPRQHDIRFVEDNWESPALGAWGLGWEVWLDGMEISQFTYFQQAGGIVLDPVSVELTYGLERIAMSLQRVRNFRDLRWNDSLTYGDVNLQGEQEHSRYYFEIADVDRLHEMFDLYEAEAKSALANHLVLPSHDYVLKCSHTFNVLDSRGAIGVTERQALFSRMRELSRRTAEEYIEQRQRMEYPWFKESESKNTIMTTGEQSVLTTRVATRTVEADASPQDLLFEIGTEELPAADLSSAVSQLQEMMQPLLQKLRLRHGDIHVFGTPRRLAIWVEKLAIEQADQSSVIKGPPANRAFDAMGQPTQVALGFARSKGVDVKNLEVQEIDGGRYVVIMTHEMGKKSIEVLSEALPGLIAAIRFDKSMRWNSSNINFSRPIRWILAIQGNQVIPFKYAGLESNRITHGLRFYTPDSFTANSPTDYINYLGEQGILLDMDKRKQVISEQVHKLIKDAGGVEKIDADLLDEVTQLVEAPNALFGKFDKSNLDLPPEVLTSVMKKHQRYFPIYMENGELLPGFITVRNGDQQHLDIVADGNEQVIQARFADAAFFIKSDLKKKLEDFIPRLSTLTFQAKLGSMLDKSERICRLVTGLLPQFSSSEAETATAQRSAKLCKADLISHMVVEMTSLQGIMGRYYALHSGESEAVAQVIFEHHLPRFAGDGLPKSLPGLVVGLADRLDTLAGMFAIGLSPSGAKDPFALRRAALGLVQNLIAWDMNFDLSAGLSLALQTLPVSAPPESLASCLDFIQGRLRSLLLEQGYRYDVVDSVLTVQGNNPAGAKRAVIELSGWTSRSDWSTILPAYARCVRITRDQPEQYSVNLKLLSETDEKELYHSLQTAEAVSRKPGSVNDLFNAFLPLIPTINHFFDTILVMVEEKSIRENRLGLLQRIAALTKGVADITKLEGF